MNVKIKVNEDKTTDLYIDGVKYGQHIIRYEIKQNALEKPTLILYCTINELGFECADCNIEKEVI